ncbi:AcvB/VirJ family lysyl-phosphatidylglycerol hydrolase [Dyadobacter subterraneus]|uniref:Virulence factor n=1 Tax=Dyadobacter subterraneus TaxID=2773304 RepID=A0ABR9WFF2_9BACT|nr:AcvB/VirJ family lysyl-phosphatidylglycerol hydrolase [Dyadobacter subterraneus]MBE9463056.1 virulence factor [Dyadobacter subterraneus]
MRFKLILLLFVLSISVKAHVPDSLQYGIFGKLKVYQPLTSPKQLVLFISGDGGWNQGVIDMADNFVAMDAMVVGIDIRSYLKNLQNTRSACYYPAADLENLSKFIQKKYRYKNYVSPLLVGYSSGATLVYGILAQSPANTFCGALALGFCPDIQINKQLCAGSGLKSHSLGKGKGFYLEAAKNLQEPFIALQGMQDQICDFKTTASFLKQIPNAKLIALQKVGHGYSVQKNWVPQLKTAFIEIISKKQDEVKNNREEINESELKELPIHAISSKSNPEKPMVFLITGDGGYTSFDQAFCKELANNGMPVVALDALKYFWNEKTPASTTVDVEKLISFYRNKWQRDKIILIGYSFGADAFPFVYNNFDKTTRESVQLLAMLSPATEADFEIHISDMLSLPRGKRQYDVSAEVNKIKNLKIICLYGSEEEPEIKSEIKNPEVSFVTIPGGHHYNNSYKQLVNIIVQKSDK